MYLRFFILKHFTFKKMKISMANIDYCMQLFDFFKCDYDFYQIEKILH